MTEKKLKELCDEEIDVFTDEDSDEYSEEIEEEQKKLYFL